MWEWVQHNYLMVFAVITMTFGAGLCLVYSPVRSTRLGGVLLSAASVVVGYNLLGLASGWIVCGLAILFLLPPCWARRPRANHDGAGTSDAASSR